MNQPAPVRLSTRYQWLYHTVMYGSLIGNLGLVLYSIVNRELAQAVLFSLWSISQIYLIREIPRLRTVRWVGNYIEVDKMIIPLDAVASVDLRAIRDAPVGKIHLIESHPVLGNKLCFLPSLKYGTQYQEVDQTVQKLQSAIDQAKHAVAHQ